ncbi:MAG: 3'-5' exonuclease domain-containing protein 2 [Verrucomicrobiales bacterium]
MSPSSPNSDHPTPPHSNRPSSPKRKSPRKEAPSRSETSKLPPFDGLRLDQIFVPTDETACRHAVKTMIEAGIVGFDTEAKPTFRRGQKSDGPHVVQFALSDKAYIFQLQHAAAEQAAAEIIEARDILKVGFGLKNDRGQIRNRLGIELQHVLDLDEVFRQLGYRGQIGVRGAIGVLLRKGFKKSKSTTTSNWAKLELTAAQLLYAANDAYAALKIIETLEKNGMLDPSHLE